MKGILITLSEETSEIRELLRTLDVEVLETFYQNRPSPDPRSFIGKGKIEEIAEWIDEQPEGSKPDIIVVNGEVKPHQRFGIEQEIGIEAFDRIRVILEIFRKRAVSEEAKLQVELAGLRYEFPWIKELIHRTRVGEHPGLLGGGEYQTRQYFTRGRRRERHIRKLLEGLEKNRGLMRSNRHRKGFTTVSITGYTNAGKSTLFNALTNENVLVDDRMFATLSTTTRRFGTNQPRILLTDTIGFLENLPPWMIKAFNSTMEEVFRSDIVVLVMDGTDSEDEILRKVETCFGMIVDLENAKNMGNAQTGRKHAGDGIDKRDQMIIGVLNKIDRMESSGIERTWEVVNREFPNMDMVRVSAREELGLDELRERIIRCHESLIEAETVHLFIPEDEGSASFINWLYEHTIVKGDNAEKSDGVESGIGEDSGKGDGLESAIEEDSEKRDGLGRESEDGHGFAYPAGERESGDDEQDVDGKGGEVKGGPGAWECVIGDMRNGGAGNTHYGPRGRSMVLEVPSRYLKEFRERCAGAHAEILFPGDDAHSS